MPPATAGARQPLRVTALRQTNRLWQTDLQGDHPVVGLPVLPEPLPASASSHLCVMDDTANREHLSPSIQVSYLSFPSRTATSSPLAHKERAMRPQRPRMSSIPVRWEAENGGQPAQGGRGAFQSDTRFLSRCAARHGSQTDSFLTTCFTVFFHAGRVGARALSHPASVLLFPPHTTSAGRKRKDTIDHVYNKHNTYDHYR
jgi:hypothetical protein